MSTSRLHRPVVLLAALLLCGLATASGLTATAPPARANAPTARTQASDAKPGKLMLVLDSSGSMKERAAGGETKIVAAKKALNQTIGRLPSNQPVGLRVFGAKVFSAKDAGACTDSQLKVPVATNNRSDLRSAVASYKPYGETPIGYALEQTGKDLGTSGKRSIVLVSDGEPTCKPDPCVVARKLASQGVDLKIDVVGLDVNSKARSSLQCIAKAGHGVYYDVDNSEDFANSLIKVATRAARPYRAIGRPITGGTSATSAPAISNGDWLDHTTGQKDHYFVVKRTLANSIIHFSAAFPSNEPVAFNTVTLLLPDGEQCDASGGGGAANRGQLVTAAAVAGPVSAVGNGIDASSKCATAKTLIAKTEYAEHTPGVPVELRVTELPKVTNLASLPQPPHDNTFSSPPSSTPHAVQGGTSFDDAPTLTPGSYSDSIVVGETLTYQVKLDWGQQLNAKAVFPDVSGTPRADGLKGQPLVNVSVFSPARAPAGSVPSGNLSSQAALFANGATIGTASGPVSVRNSNQSGAGVAGADLAGLYTVTVFLSRSDTAKSIPIPFKLDLGVTGARAGVPDFASTPIDPASNDPSASPSGKADSSTSTKAGNDGGGFPTGPVLGGLGVLAILAALVVALRSRASAS